MCHAYHSNQSVIALRQQFCITLQISRELNQMLRGRAGVTNRPKMASRQRPNDFEFALVFLDHPFLYRRRDHFILRTQEVRSRYGKGTSFFLIFAIHLDSEIVVDGCRVGAVR